MTARVAAIILAAGLGRRFGAEGSAKAVAPVGGVPMVRLVATAALASRATPVLVVCGHAADAVETALAGVDATLVPNPAYATGLASSLQAGLAALPDDIDGAAILLADMPFVATQTIDMLISRSDPTTTDAVVPTYAGRRGNPVLVGRRLFPRLRMLRGDEGARQLLASPGLAIVSCEVDDRGVTIDIDTRGELDGVSNKIRSADHAAPSLRAKRSNPEPPPPPGLLRRSAPRNDG